MDNILPTNTGILAALASAIIVVVGGAYKAYRMIKGDLREDRSVQSQDKFIEGKDKRIKELEERTDKLSEERIKAMELVGSLNGEVKVLTSRIEEIQLHSQLDLKRLQEENRVLREQNQKILQITNFKKDYPEVLNKIKNELTTGENNDR